MAVTNAFESMAPRTNHPSLSGRGTKRGGGSGRRRNTTPLLGSSYSTEMPRSIGTDSEGANSQDGQEDETPELKEEREKSRRQANNARER